MAEPDRILTIMAKAPSAGAVKTRLARSVGAVEALRFYRTSTARLLRRLDSDPRWRILIAVAPDRALRSRFWPLGPPRLGQGSGDLGTRMQRLFDLPIHGPVVIVGSDIPGIKPAHIAETFRLLGRHDIVFGPAEDGGYWLVGARRRPVIPRPFSGVRWSTEHALADTIARVKGSVGFLPVLADVDTEEDWRRWRRREGSFG